VNLETVYFTGCVVTGCWEWVQSAENGKEWFLPSAVWFWLGSWVTQSFCV